MQFLCGFPTDETSLSASSLRYHSHSRIRRRPLQGQPLVHWEFRLRAVLERE